MYINAVVWNRIYSKIMQNIRDNYLFLSLLIAKCQYESNFYKIKVGFKTECNFFFILMKKLNIF